MIFLKTKVNLANEEMEVDKNEKDIEKRDAEAATLVLMRIKEKKEDIWCNRCG